MTINMASQSVVILATVLMISRCLSANIALGRPANQTGTGGGFAAGQAVDGNKDNKSDPEYYKTTCAGPSISQGVAQWWVDLEGTYTVDNVAVFNTYNLDSSTKMNHFYVDVVEDDNSQHRCGSYSTDNPILPGGSVTFSCNTRGRYVFITKLPGHSNQGLSICEVKVDGSLIAASTGPTITATTYRYRATKLPGTTSTDVTLTDLPLSGKATNQTGTYNQQTSDRAVDDLYLGNGGSTGEHGNCAHPNNPTGQAAEWWVDLERMYKLTSITVYNTNDSGGHFRLANFMLRAYSPGIQPPLTCATHPGTVGSGSSETLTCADNVYGQYIQFIRLGGREIHLVTLCEVKITGQFYSGCPAGYYGDACDMICDKCATDPDVYNPCDKNGHCVNGCQMWWITDSCQTEITEINRTSETVTVTSSSNTVEVNLHQISIPSDVSEFYGYRVSYGTNLRYLAVSGTGMNTFTLTDLDYDTEYTITIKPYRAMGTQYGYGTGYPPQTIRTQSAPTAATSSTTTTATTTPTTTTTSAGAPATVDDGLSQTNIIIIAVVLAGVLIIILIVALGIVLTRRKKSRNEVNDDMKHSVSSAVAHPPLGATNKAFTEAGVESETSTRSPSPIPTIEEEVIEVAEPPPAQETQSLSDEENPYANAFIPISMIENYVQEKLNNPEEFAKEYKTLPAIDHSRYKIAITDDNKKKNRFLNIYPYDLTRVTLEEDSPQSGGDYINATFITGYNNAEKAYIATQGPVHITMRDFWQMIWQYNANRLIMVANLTEDGKRKCDQYWDENMGNMETHGEFTVTVEAIQECADHTIRVITLSKEGVSRTVRQYHFTSWKDKGRPLFGAVTLLNFHKKVHSMDNIATGPLIIHCSAGVGRTGTFIALDILLQQIEHERAVDIYGCVQKMRRERMLMVQTKDQYAFLHEAIVEAAKVGNAAYPCSGLAETLQQLSEEDDKNGSDLQREFQLLSSLKNKTEDPYKEGLSDVNNDKNRDLNIVPAESDRPYLSTPYAEGNHYINAVYVDSFKKHNYYVVTQMPLPATQPDLWRLTYDHQFNTIVMLNELDESDETCKQYWPDEGSQVYGPLKVHHISTTNVSSYLIMREFRISEVADDENIEAGSNVTLSGKNSRTHALRHYQMLGWPNSEMFPPDRSALLGLMDEIHKWQHQRQMTGRMGQVVVHCMNGGTRSGLFCGLSHTLDRMKLEQEVDAFLAVRYVSRRRQQFFQTLEEYRFLYEMAIQYMSRYDTYANFQ